MKFKSDDLVERLKRFSENNLIGKSTENIFLGALKKCYQCNLCEKTFSRQGDFKKHKKMEHRRGREEIGEV